MNKISVIVPMYNAEKTIERCINSILKQTISAFEIVLINDGSTDRTEDIVRRLQNEKSNIKYFYKENSGVAQTRNYGIEKAQGDYIIFVDADDYIEPNLIEKVFKYIENNIEMVKFKLKKIDTNGKELEKIDGPVFNKKNGEDAFDILYYQDTLIDSPCVYLIKRSLFTDNRLEFKGKYHEDFGLMPILIALSKSIVSIPDYLYVYVQEENSITRNEDYQKTIQKMEDVLFHYDRMLKIIKNTSIKNATQDNIKTFYTNAIILKLQELKKDDRKKYIKEIRNRKMCNNIKAKNLKQFIKRLILKLNINLYLKIR